ncbi:uncharacterized protein LOC109864258 [Pseudomyrmex gracilis]|uniref:uncharacterized protein LOC109864258 n=1 Tax=Pseudomyrmex gracilis TaxID=219809 RepID=UPI0009959996|nr:uncharacterized protein LOC109864258 [Pseudomyrmex gracilis]
MIMHRFWRFSRVAKRRKRTLKVCLPHVIRDKNDVSIKNLFVGDFYVKLPRQSSRSCHVVFPDVESKMKNHELAKDKTINGKRVIIESLRPIQLKKRPKKIKRKKIYMPKIKSEVKVTQTLFVSNIPNDTKVNEIRDVFPECVCVTLLRSYNKNFKCAMVRMNSIEVAEEYLTKKREWPTLNEQKLYLHVDTRKKHKKRTPKSLKIYDENGTEIPKSSESLNCIKEENESN